MEDILQRRPWLTPTLLALLSLLFFGGVLWTPGQIIAAPDIEGLFVPWLTYAVESLRQGVFPLWDTNQFSGYPFFANIQVGLFYPPNWLFLILPVSTGLAVNLALHVWLGGWGMARLVQRLGGSHSGALIAGLAFAFSGFTAVRVAEGHYGYLNTFAWTPWVVLAYWWAAREGRWHRYALAGAPFGMAILAGHITSMLYVALILLAAAIYQTVVIEGGDGKQRLLRAGLPLLVMVAVGAALAGVQLVPTAEFAMFSTRVSAGFDDETIARYSMYPEHLLTLAAPDFFGQPLITGYWARGAYSESMYYAGVVPLLLALLALRAPTLRRPATFLALLAGVGLLLALGVNGPLYPVAYRLLPPFRWAGVPARAGFLFLFGVCALAGLAATQRADPQDRRRLLRPLNRWLWAIIGAALLAALAAFLLFALNLPGSEAGRAFHMGNALLLFAIWAALGTGALTWWARAPSARWAPALAAALVLLDLWTFGLRLVKAGPYPPMPLWGVIQSLTGEAYRREGPFRILPWGFNTFWQNGATLTEDVESVFGYNTMELTVYNAFTSVSPDWRARAYDLLNARYVAHWGALEDASAYTYLGEGYGVYVYERPNWMPRAWLAGRYEVAADPIARLNQPDFAYRATVLLEAEPPCAPQGDGAGTAKVVAETADRVQLSVEAESPSLLVYSGQYYPGWTAAVDGAPAEVLRADAVLRAVCVPAGAHTVAMTFQPASLTVGALLSLAAAALLTVAVRAWARRR